MVRSDHSVTGLLPISFSAQAESKQFEIPIKALCVSTVNNKLHYQTLIVNFGGFNLFFWPVAHPNDVTLYNLAFDVILIKCSAKNVNLDSSMVT